MSGTPAGTPWIIIIVIAKSSSVRRSHFRANSGRFIALLLTRAKRDLLIISHARAKNARVSKKEIVADRNDNESLRDATFNWIFDIAKHSV